MCILSQAEVIKVIWGEVDVRGCQTGKGFDLARKQAVQERGSAAQTAEDEERFFDGLCFVPGKQDVIEKETEPMDQRPNRLDEIEQQEKDEAFAGETSRPVVGSEERGIGCPPEEAKVINH